MSKDYLNTSAAVAHLADPITETYGGDIGSVNSLDK